MILLYLRENAVGYGVVDWHGVVIRYHGYQWEPDLIVA